MLDEQTFCDLMFYGYFEDAYKEARRYGIIRADHGWQMEYGTYCAFHRCIMIDHYDRMFTFHLRNGKITSMEENK